MAAEALLPAFVLHSRRYRDSSLIIDFFTRPQGRVAVVARGQLRRKRGAGQPQPFQPFLISLRGRGELRTLGALDPGGKPETLSGSVLYCGLYLNELVLRLTARDDPFPAVFDSYQEAISSLSAGATPEPVLRRFEIRLLRQLGHGMVLDTDCYGQTIEAHKRYNYTVGKGAAPSTSGSGEISGATLLAMGREQLDSPALLAEARRLMRQVIDHHLEGRPLRTRELFRQPSD